MLISVPKCAVLSSTASSALFLNGTPIPQKTLYKDLGILMSPTLDFSDQVTKVVKCTSRLSGVIFRTFIIKRVEFYVKLYKTLIQPHFLYCCSVWSPYKQKDVQALERVRTRFIKRVANRCHISQDNVILSTVMDLHRVADVKLFHRLDAKGLAENLFDISLNNLRSSRTIRSHEVAHNEKINQMYTFRLPRILR